MSCVSSHVNIYSIAAITHKIDDSCLFDEPCSSSLLDEATRLVQLGFSVIPIKPDGTKAPPIPWGPYQTRRPSVEELTTWFRDPGPGLAVIAGWVSGHLEIIDCDDAAIAGAFRQLADEVAPGLLDRCPQVRTPRPGLHVYYRCETVEGNLKLARTQEPSGTIKTLIETRGEGGYVLAPPSPPACHPTHRPYVWCHGDLARIPVLTEDERATLLGVARSLNEYVEPPLVMGGDTPRHQGGTRPGDDFRDRVPWEEILRPHGWVPVRQRGAVTHWRRPGKEGRGCSATTNHAGRDLLYVFSSNAPPFQDGRAYGKFMAYALLNHQGDCRRASNALRRDGYGHARAGGVLYRRPDGAMVYRASPRRRRGC